MPQIKSQGLHLLTTKEVKTIEEMQKRLDAGEALTFHPQKVCMALFIIFGLLVFFISLSVIKAADLQFLGALAGLLYLFYKVFCLISLDGLVHLTRDSIRIHKLYMVRTIPLSEISSVWYFPSRTFFSIRLKLKNEKYNFSVGCYDFKELSAHGFIELINRNIVDEGMSVR